MREAVIVSAVRTAVGKAPKGTLRATRPDDLAAVAIRGALDRVPNLDARDAGLLVNALYDSRDTPTYALHGAAAQLQYFRSSDSMGADRNWNRIEGGFRSAVPFIR